MDDTRKQAARRINAAMSRIPLLVEILDELERGVSPGDEDIRKGVNAAFSSILSYLQGIRPTSLGTPDTEAEQVAFEWLLGEQAGRLIPSEIMAGLSREITRVLPVMGIAKDIHSKI